MMQVMLSKNQEQFQKNGSIENYKDLQVRKNLELNGLRKAVTQGLSHSKLKDNMKILYSAFDTMRI